MIRHRYDEENELWKVSAATNRGAWTGRSDWQAGGLSAVVGRGSWVVVVGRESWIGAADMEEALLTLDDERAISERYVQVVQAAGCSNQRGLRAGWWQKA